MRLNTIARPGLALILLVASGASAYHALRDSPKGDSGPLVPDLPVQDLGRLRQGVSRSAYFQLTNSSSRTVYISRIIDSCSCTSHAISESKISPRSATRLRLDYDSGASRGSDSATVTVLYFLEGEDQLRKLVVGVKASVDPDVATSADRLEFASENPDVKTVELRANQIGSLEVQAVTCTHRAFSATLEPLGLDRHTRRVIRVSFDPAQWHDPRHTAELHVTTNSPSEPLMRIRLSVKPSEERTKS